MISKHLHFKTRMSIECNIIGLLKKTRQLNTGIKGKKEIKFVLSNCIKSRKGYH